MRLLLPLPTLQLPVYSLADELCPVLVVLKNGVDSLKRTLRESCGRLFVVDLFSTHARNIDDITNCYKPLFCRYHLLRSYGLMIPSNHRNGRQT